MSDAQTSAGDNEQLGTGNSAAARPSEEKSLKERLADAMPEIPVGPSPAVRKADEQNGSWHFPGCEACNADVVFEEFGGRTIWVCTKFGKVQEHWGHMPDEPTAT